MRTNTLQAALRELQEERKAITNAIDAIVSVLKLTKPEGSRTLDVNVNGDDLVKAGVSKETAKLMCLPSHNAVNTKTLEQLEKLKSLSEPFGAVQMKDHIGDEIIEVTYARIQRWRNYGWIERVGRGLYKRTETYGNTNTRSV